MADHSIPRTKLCIHCRQELPATPEFFYTHPQMGDGLLNCCKSCFSAQSGERYRRNRERIRIAAKAKYEANKDAILASQKEYYQRNRELIAERNKEYRQKNQEAVKARAKRHREANREKINEKLRAYNKKRYAEGRVWRITNREQWREYHREYSRKWLQSSGKRRLCHSITIIMARSIKGGKDGASWEALVGYTRAELVRHIERQFDRRMTWENYGQWHIDHIRPKVSFNFESISDPEFLECWALTNLRPLWGKENSSKGGKRLHLL